MNLPTIPSNFSSGEVLTADRMNQILDWMRSVSALLPGLELTTGSGLRISKTPSGTVLSVDPNANGADFIPPHPFHVRVLYDDNGSPSAIAIAGGSIIISLYTPPSETLAFNAVTCVNAVRSVYIEPQKLSGNPSGQFLYLRFRRNHNVSPSSVSWRLKDSCEFILSSDESLDWQLWDARQYAEAMEFVYVKIAKFTTSDSGLVLVSQYLRSDIFFTNGADYASPTATRLFPKKNKILLKILSSIPPRAPSVRVIGQQILELI